MYETIGLVVEVWDNNDYGGAKRVLIESISDLHYMEFDNRPTSIAIHPGPNYDDYKGNPPTVSLYEHAGYIGRELVLSPGLYPNFTQFKFNEISSIRINLADYPRLPGLYEGTRNVLPLGNATPASPISSIPLIVALYKEQLTTDLPLDKPLYATDDASHGPVTYLVVIQPTLDVERHYGREFNDAASTVIVRKGPNYKDEVARLWADAGHLGGAVEFDPNVIDKGHNVPGFFDLPSRNFDNAVSCIEIGSPTELDKIVPA